MQIIKFVKKWMLLCAMAFGACVYLLFAEVPLLQPVGMVVGPYFEEILPLLIFSILYVTFCKIRLHDLHFRAWFFWLQLVRIAMAGLLVIAQAAMNLRLFSRALSSVSCARRHRPQP